MSTPITSKPSSRRNLVERPVPHPKSRARLPDTCLRSSSGRSRNARKYVRGNSRSAYARARSASSYTFLKISVIITSRFDESVMTRQDLMPDQHADSAGPALLVASEIGLLLVDDLA